MKSTLRLALIVVVLVLGATFTNEAAASDAKVYSGVECQRTASAGTSEAFSYTIEGIFNTSPDLFLIVTCPIVTDNTTTNDGLQGDLLIRMRDFNFNTGPFCDAFAINRFGGIIAREFFQVPDGGQFFGFYEIHLRLTRSEEGGNYIFQCVLGPNEGIISYFVNER